jgi:acyl dehydratase
MITFKIGHKFTLLRKFSKDEVMLFSQLCGDKNPLHYDEEFCKNTIFKKPIIFGILGASLFSNLLGNNLDGSIYIKQSLNFLKPIFIDEEIEASVEIKDLIKPKNFLMLKTQVIKLETKEVAIDGEAVVKFPKDKYQII